MKKLNLTLIIVLFGRLLALAQNDTATLKNIIFKLDRFSEKHPVEKVYLHFNKPSYFVGDTIWFKGYLTVGALHQPSALSNILYIDLINDHNKIVRSLTLKVVNSSTSAYLPVDNTIRLGWYRVRAYTNWMRNAGSDYFFQQDLLVDDIKTNAIVVSGAINSNDNTRANAKISYTDKNGSPYHGKEISYEVKTDTLVISRGKTVTDDNGNINITFPENANSKNVNIVSHIQLLKGIVADKTIVLRNTANKADIQFFPEGGESVNDVRSKVAFKATGSNGLGIQVSGIIIDDNNQEIATINSQHAGMGVFAYTPHRGRRYSAKIKLPDSTVMDINLPAAQDNGLILAVNNSDSLNLIVRVATNQQTLAGNKNSSYFLLAQSQGRAYYTTVIKLTEATFTAIIPKSKLPTGINQFTLFSSSMEPLNERVVFVQNSDQLDLAIDGLKQLYKQKEKVDLTLLVKKQESGQPTASGLSVSVFNEDKLAIREEGTNNILSSLLLSSDIRGYIENAGYYFNQQNQQTRADLDVLLLTQAYRRFAWKELIADQYPDVSFAPEKGLSIAGQLTTAGGKPIINGKVSLISTLDKVKIDTTSDNNGRFNFPDIEFPDSTSLIIQARKANDGKNVTIALDEQKKVPYVSQANIAETYQGAPNIGLPAAKNTDANDNLAVIEKKVLVDGSNTLKDVDIKEKKITPPSKYNNYGAGYQYNLNMARARDYNSVYDAVEEQVPGVVYKNGRLYYEGAPIRLSLVNGLENNISYLRVLDPADIENISLSSGKSAGVVVVVTTKSFAGTDTIRLKTVTIKGQRSKEIAPWKAQVETSANLNGPGFADQVIAGNQLDGCLTLGDCLQSKIPGIITKNGKFYFPRHAAQSIMNPPAISFVIDGLFVSGEGAEDLLNNVIVSDVQTIEVLKSTSYLSIYGQNASGGLLIITTKYGSADNLNAYAYKSVPGVIYTKFKGFYKSRQFYLPKYDKPGLQINDTRPAVYWNPFLVSSDNGKASFSFFNSDLKGNYRVVIEGIDNDGKLGHKVYHYRIE